MPRGLEVSQTDLKDTATQDKTFSSRQLSPKSRIEGDDSVVTNGVGEATARVYHGLTYPPAHLFFFKPGNVRAVINPGISGWTDKELATTWGLMDNNTFTVSTEALYCNVRILGVPNTRYSFHYFIFSEPAK